MAVINAVGALSSEDSLVLLLQHASLALCKLRDEKKSSLVAVPQLVLAVTVHTCCLEVFTLIIEVNHHSGSHLVDCYVRKLCRG